MIRNFDIFKTFDLFEQVSLSIIKETLIKLVFIESDNIFTAKPEINVDITKDNNAQFTIINNKRVYNLLNSAIIRQNKRKDNESIKC